MDSRKKRRIDPVVSISEEGVAIAPSAGWQNPTDAPWRQLLERGQVISRLRL